MPFWQNNGRKFFMMLSAAPKYTEDATKVYGQKQVERQSHQKI
jgi:hypothetical protein